MKPKNFEMRMLMAKLDRARDRGDTYYRCKLKPEMFDYVTRVLKLDAYPLYTNKGVRRVYLCHEIRL